MTKRDKKEKDFVNDSTTILHRKGLFICEDVKARKEKLRTDKKLKRDTK